MAKNKRIPTRSHPMTWIEANLDRKSMRKGPTHSEPTNIEITPAASTDADGTITPDPQVAVVAIPLSTHAQIYQSGLTYQDGDPDNLPAISGFEEGDEITGPNGNYCMVVAADKEGLHKWDISTLMLNDRGQFSVMVRGKGEVTGEDYEYVLSVHGDFVDPPSPSVDQESLVIRWEYDDAATPTSVLRLYPNLAVYAGDYIEIELDEADWYDETWHKITATWSYQDQEWTLKWDDTEGTPTLPNTIAWPDWDEYTEVEIFTDMEFGYPIYHYLAHVLFGPITDLQALGIGLTTYVASYPKANGAAVGWVLPSRPWQDETVNVFVNQIDHPRLVTATCLNGDIMTNMTGTITINGIDADGAALADVLTINVPPGGPVVYTTTHAYVLISSIVTDQTDAHFTDTYSIGTNDTFGVPNYPITSVHKCAVEGIDNPFILISATYGLISPNPVVVLQKDLVFFYRTTP